MNALNRTLLCALAIVTASGCSATIAIETDPISQDIPFQSVAIPAYSEIAIDMPEEAQEGPPQSVIVESLTMTGQVLNPMQYTSLEMALKLSFTGTAIPGTLLQHPVKPTYYDSAEALIPSAAYSANTTTPFSIPKEPLLKIIGQKRIYILINNTVQSLDLRDSTPKLRLQNVQIQALITKEFTGLGPGTEVIGL